MKEGSRKKGRKEIKPKNQNFNFSVGCMSVCVWACCVHVGSQCKMYFLLRYHQDNLKTTTLKVVMLCPVDQGAI